MKQIKHFLVVLTLLLCANSYSQAFSTSGYYSGSMTYYTGKSSSTSNIKFYVYPAGGVEFDNLSPAVFKTLAEKNITTYTWINSGGIWTESQTWIFSKNATNGEITATFLRVVQNEGQEPWYVMGTGLIYKN